MRTICYMALFCGYANLTVQLFCPRATQYLLFTWDRIEKPDYGTTVVYR